MTDGQAAGTRRGAAIALGFALLAASSQAGAEPASAALRRACATGALTAYACVQRGVKPPPGAEPVAPAPSAPKTALSKAAPKADAVSAPPAPADAAPAAGRGRRAARQAKAQPYEGASPLRPYQDTQRRYDLQIPEGWTLKMEGGVAGFAHGDAWMQLRSIPAAGAKAVVGGGSGMEILRAAYAQFQTRSDEALTVGGRPGRRLVMTAVSRGGRPSALEMVSASMPSGETFLVLAGGSPEDAVALDAGVTALTRSVRFR